MLAAPTHLRCDSQQASVSKTQIFGIKADVMSASPADLAAAAAAAGQNLSKSACKVLHCSSLTTFCWVLVEPANALVRWVHIPESSSRCLLQQQHAN
jgi:hypothetical protein